MGRRRMCAHDLHCRAGGGALNPDLYGVRATSGTVIDANTVEIRFSKGVSVQANTGIEVDVDGAGFVEVTGNSKIDDKTWRFTIAASIMAGDTVQWRYLGGSDSIIDLDKSMDVGPLGVTVRNNMVLDGDFFLLQTGGRDIFLLQDDLDGTTGFLLQEAP